MVNYCWAQTCPGFHDGITAARTCWLLTGAQLWPISDPHIWIFRYGPTVASFCGAITGPARYFILESKMCVQNVPWLFRCLYFFFVQVWVFDPWFIIFLCWFGFKSFFPLGLFFWILFSVYIFIFPTMFPPLFSLTFRCYFSLTLIFVTTLH